MLRSYVMTTTRLLVPVAAVLALLLSAVGGPPVQRAEAAHVAGATYRGAVDGGGEVTVIVSADGATFAISVAWSGPTCNVAISFAGLPVSNHAFQAGSGGNLVSSSVSGAFKEGGVVEGSASQPGCGAATRTWRATAGAPAPGSSTVTQTVVMSITPNGAYAPGANAVVVQGVAEAQAAVDRIVADSGRAVLALWAFVDGRWRFFLPATPAIDGGLAQFSGPVSSAYAVLG